MVLTAELSSAINGLPSGENLEPATQEVGKCDKHGEFTKWTRKIPFLKNKFETKCPHCLREEIKRIEEKLHSADSAGKQKIIESLKEQSGIPRRFVDASFNNYQETEKNRLAKLTCQRYAEKWAERFEQGGGLVFCGKPGTGKNHLACAIANSVIEQHQAEVLLTTAMRIIRKVKSTWDKGSSMSEEDVIRMYCQKDLLIIDEVGVQFGTDAEKIILFEIINERYAQMLPTILISNLTESELSGYIGERIIDRMKEGKGAVIKFDWESYRK
ncbi:ATP-binding protein [Aggregatibacter actinomycetemcomitans]|nr:ATP-binding protein [Aggregatibacter actinomycetemcomitans]MBN6068852.1 ATP-binding protein [Aggregatibacter actinomycetemcomitans]MBN6069431.1 ATP-binding protein [Aggregatibacter actinomycetemcomitans]MBN6069487.1 ATP-binding protein [Aggregatibacter actinomycetemcomitans]MBN6086942.1 ATP-binding protein [Aggregatibacter actinomycetemcomitans]